MCLNFLNCFVWLAKLHQKNLNEKYTRRFSFYYVLF